MLLAVASGAQAQTYPMKPIRMVLPFHAVIWSGMLAPAKTPAAIIDRLNAEVVRALAAPDVRGRMLNQLGLDPVGTKPSEFGQFVRDEITKWAKIAKAAGVKATD